MSHLFPIAPTRIPKPPRFNLSADQRDALVTELLRVVSVIRFTGDVNHAFRNSSTQVPLLLASLEGKNSHEGPGWNPIDVRKVDAWRNDSDLSLNWSLTFGIRGDDPLPT